MFLILGCGYLGVHVAQRLKSLDSVAVTTRSLEKLSLLQKEFSAFLLHSSDLTTLKNLLLKPQVLIVTVAADDANQYQSAYLDTANQIKKALEHNSSLKQIIYTSSTSVYGDAQGKIVTEESPTLALSKQGKILIETEQVFLSLKRQERNITIFRLPEIYGPSRALLQRVERLQGKKAPGDGSQIAHLIHVEDIAEAIAFAIKHSLEGIYNLCSDDCISRKELYDAFSKNYNLPYVEWDPTLLSIHRSGSKLISNQKIKKTGFKLLHSTCSI